MAFVPPIPRQTASPEAQDLANRLAALVQEYRRDHPDLSERAVRDAMEAAAGSTRRADRRAVAVTAALVAAFVGAATFLGQGGVGARAFPVVAVAALVAVLAAIVARRRA
jgi:CRISPR/Cas system endoribonuclease Cas6 (RAMP superfamily)